MGAVTGFVCAIFRMALEQADRLRDLAIAWAHGQALVGFLLVVMAGAAAALAAWLVRRFAPHATGSGIPHVEAVLRQDFFNSLVRHLAEGLGVRWVFVAECLPNLLD